jgi:hypothetical protein
MRVQRDADTWSLSWDEHGIGMGFESLRDSSTSLKARVMVESTVAGRVLGPVSVDLLSMRAQSEFANACADRVNGLGKDAWKALVVQACAVVSKQWAEPTPTVDLSTEEDSGKVEYLVKGLIPRGETTVMYGDGESAKSLLALRVAFSVALGSELPWGERPVRGNVLYLDWETNTRTVASRLRRLALGELCAKPPIFYRQCFRSLVDDLPSIREEISKRNIALVIVDSIGFAASGALVEDETARTAMNALRAMTPATRLVVAHVSKSSAEATSGKSKPFGSAFFWNGMRSGFEVRRSEEQASDNQIDLGIYHHKSNDGGHIKPFGLTVLFDTEKDGIVFDKTDIQDVPDLASRTSLSNRIRALLQKGAMDTHTLAEELEVKDSTIRTTAGRMADVVPLRPAGGKGKVAMWGLSEGRPGGLENGL